MCYAANCLLAAPVVVSATAIHVSFVTKPISRCLSKNMFDRTCSAWKLKFNCKLFHVKHLQFAADIVFHVKHLQFSVDIVFHVKQSRDVKLLL